MEGFVKYLVESPLDNLWGLSVTVAGYTKIPSNTVYPPVLEKHPAGYQFTWENGRRLHEYQIVYITRGKGVIDTEKSKKTTITEGDIILLFPGVWHRYKCSLETGWDEYYIGCKGSFIESLVENGFFTPEIPVLKIGQRESVMRLFNDVFDAVREEKTGFQQEASGATTHMLGRVYSLYKNRGFKGKEIEEIIHKARMIMIENINKELDYKILAKDLNKGYSWFRKKFKEYTGMAPGQYHLLLRINKAKEMLLSSSMSIKNISFELGFESNFYFSRVFKTKTGMPPQEFRRRTIK